MRIPAVGHTYGDLIPAKEADCETRGNIPYYQCSECGQFFNEAKVKVPENDVFTAPKGHTYGDMIPAKEVGCETEGNIAYYHCDVCGKYFNEEKYEISEEIIVIPAKGHNYYCEVTKKATYTEQGSGIYTCLNCGDSSTPVLTSFRFHTTV